MRGVGLKYVRIVVGGNETGLVSMRLLGGRRDRNSWSMMITRNNSYSSMGVMERKRNEAGERVGDEMSKEK